MLHIPTQGPSLLPQIMLISPCNAEKLKYDRDALMFHPSGTGPYRIQKMVAHHMFLAATNDLHE